MTGARTPGSLWHDIVSVDPIVRHDGGVVLGKRTTERGRVQTDERLATASPRPSRAPT